MPTPNRQSQSHHIRVIPKFDRTEKVTRGHFEACCIAENCGYEDLRMLLTCLSFNFLCWGSNPSSEKSCWHLWTNPLCPIEIAKVAFNQCNCVYVWQLFLFMNLDSSSRVYVKINTWTSLLSGFMGIHRLKILSGGWGENRKKKLQNIWFIFIIGMLDSAHNSFISAIELIITITNNSSLPGCLFLIVEGRKWKPWCLTSLLKSISNVELVSPDHLDASPQSIQKVQEEGGVKAESFWLRVTFSPAVNRYC